MARLTPQVKGIIRFARKAGVGADYSPYRLTKTQTQTIRKQLRSPGVSNLERKLRRQVATNALYVTHSQSEKEGVAKALHEQAKISKAAGESPSDKKARAKYPHTRNVK